MVFGTIIFFIFAILTILFIVITIISIVNNEDFSSVLGIFIAICLAITISIFFTPYSANVFFENEYNLNDMIDETDYKVAVLELRKTEAIDYIRINNYIFNRVTFEIHTNDKSKYIEDKNDFKKYKK
jgi:hypothetical protein